MEIKYIYFEVNNITGVNATKPQIENVNILGLKPNTTQLSWTSSPKA